MAIPAETKTLPKPPTRPKYQTVSGSRSCDVHCLLDAGRMFYSSCFMVRLIHVIYMMYFKLYMTFTWHWTKQTVIGRFACQSGFTCKTKAYAWQHSKVLTGKSGCHDNVLHFQIGNDNCRVFCVYLFFIIVHPYIQISLLITHPKVVPLQFLYSVEHKIICIEERLKPVTIDSHSKKSKCRESQWLQVYHVL